MSDREWNWQNATGCSTPEDANRLMLEQSARLRQKDETIKALADVLEAHNNRRTASGMLAGYHEIILNTEEVKKMTDALEMAGRKP